MDLAYRPWDFRGRFRAPSFAEAVFAAHAMASATTPMSRSNFLAMELCLNLGDAHYQAAWFSVSEVTSTPSLNLIPLMTFGN